ncbi:MAG: type I methionyl aminopeptidase [Candidatus Kappaea frigidicola]|nr:type I methionyl aminopeptidase [Candidatus Kappaea frigidicola]
MILLKSPKEIDKIRVSCRIVKETLDLLKTKVRPGISTKELNKIGEEFICSKKAKPAFKGYMGYPAGVCTSINDEIVHGIPSDRKLQDTDIISLDVGVWLDGYFGDAARTFAVSTNVSQEAQQLMRITEESLELAVAAAKAGNRLYDISYAVQSHVEAQGYSVVRQFVGHGIGASLHEDPQIPNFGKPHTGIKLKSGMVLAIEPMINIGGYEIEVLDDGWTAVTKDGSLSAHFEHTVYISDKRVEILA